MKRLFFGVMCAVLMSHAPVIAQQGAKIGIVAPFSGPFEIYGQSFKRGAELMMEEVDGKAGNVPIELIFRDEAGGPEKTKQLTQELIVRDKVKMLGGFVFTPSALTVAPLITESKTPTILFNAATGVITRRSAYFARTSHTQWQGAYTIGLWAAKQKIKTAAILVADYAPGQDARDGFKAAFAKDGGTIVSEVNFPMNTTDFAPYLQRVKDLKPDSLYIFTPVGPPSVSLIKSYAALGLPEANIKLLGTGDTDEQVLPAMGDAALGAITAWHYSPYSTTEQNKKFVAAYQKKYGADQLPDYAVVAAYVGMKAMIEIIAKRGADVGGDAAMADLAGWTTDSPKGPITIDKAERDIVQNMYIRKVEKTSTGYANVPFETFENVGDPWKIANPK